VAGEDGSLSWLAFSLIASIVLTVVVNLALWLGPGMARWLQYNLRRLAEPPPPGDEPRTPRVRVVFPWKLMLVGSLVLTVVLNALVRLLR
jgi:hypothetical protein